MFHSILKKKIIILSKRRKASESVGGWAERERETERMEEGREEGRDRRRKGGLCYIRRSNQTINLKQSTCLTSPGIFLPVETKSSMLKDLFVA